MRYKKLKNKKVAIKFEDVASRLVRKTGLSFESVEGAASFILGSKVPEFIAMPDFLLIDTYFLPIAKKLKYIK